MLPPVTRYVALYCRLSPRPDGSYEGVAAQERWGREYAAGAWPGLPIEVFADAGISAANGDHRPEFERLRRWLEDGMICRVWSVEQYRLERREVEWFRLAAEFDAAGITELHTNRDGIVRIMDDVAGIKAVLGAGEIRRMKRRVNDKLTENAAQGLPPGSKPFGYAHARTEEGVRTYQVIEDQAEVIRWAAEKALTGWSLTSIVTELGERGVKGAHGGTIRRAAVFSMLTNPTVAGYRVHSGRVIGRGNWEPILDEDTWQALRLKLSGPRTVRRADGGEYVVTTIRRGHPGRRYLLTGGLAVCGVCGNKLAGSLKAFKGRVPKPYLHCHPNVGGRGCVGIVLEPTEAHVVDTLFAELDQPEFLEAIAADEHRDRRNEIIVALQGVERQRDELAQMWATPGALTTSEWQTARRALAENELKLRGDLASLPPVAPKMDITEARSAWPHMTLDERREFVRLFIAQVTVHRSRPGFRVFDPGRIEIEWVTT